MTHTTELSILCLNSGSSSIKCSVFAAHGDALAREPLFEVDHPRTDAPFDTLFASIESATQKRGFPIDAIGHRVVFGGSTYVAPTRVDEHVIADLEALSELAPLHLPAALALIRAASQHFPGAPQVACFDTAFHAAMPNVAKRLPIPRSLWDAGIRRYGFHGLSYEYALGELGEERSGRVVLAHLGSGASLAAVRDGTPLDTTMGFTPLGGVMMGTRPGDLDPGILLHLMRSGETPERLASIFERESGLLGVSETASDMRSLLEARATDVRAAEAVELFVYQIRKHIGALAMVLGGLELLVFTGGIGEHASAVRDEIVAGIAPLRPTVRVIATNENLVVARHTLRVVHPPTSP